MDWVFGSLSDRFLLLPLSCSYVNRDKMLPYQIAIPVRMKDDLCSKEPLAQKTKVISLGSKAGDCDTLKAGCI